LVEHKIKGRRPPTKAAIWHPGPGARTMRAETGMRLNKFILLMHTHLSGRGVKQLLDSGCCRVNGRVETYGTYELRHSDVVEVFLPETDREHLFDPKRVIFQDEWMLAYDKPAWLPVTRTDEVKSWSLTDILKQELPLAIPVHRLDADTSGLVLFAKSEKPARKLEEAFAEHQIAKTYHAIVRGHPRVTGTYKSYLIKVKAGKGFERWESGKGLDARAAETTWEVEERLGTYGSLVRVEPKSGRYHQIRIHFSEMGHPIYGDRMYGDRMDPVHSNRHLLHASEIRCDHPITKEALVLKCRLPKEFQAVMEQLRRK